MIEKDYEVVYSAVNKLKEQMEINNYLAVANSDMFPTEIRAKAAQIVSNKLGFANQKSNETNPFDVSKII